jgi:hypothetical protein
VPVVAATPVSSLRLPQPPSFDGKGNVRHWIARLQNFFRAQNCSNGEQQFFYATSLLDGAAIDWWLHVEAEISSGSRPGFSTFTKFTDALTEYFVPYSHIASAERELSMLSQVHSVENYMKAFADTTIRIPDMSDSERRRWFVRGLKPQTQREIYRQYPKSFNEARRLAQVYDVASYIQPTRQTNQTSFRSSTRPFGVAHASQRSVNHDPNAMEIGSVQANKPSKLSPAEREWLIRNNGCFSCRQLGHMSRTCPKFQFRRPTINVVSVEKMVPPDPPTSATLAPGFSDVGECKDFPLDQ